MKEEESKQVFQKTKFKQLIETALGNRSITQYSEDSTVNRTYISKIINESLDNPPSPEILKKLATHSKGRISYKELMVAAGYLRENKTNNDLTKVPVIKNIKKHIFNSSNIKKYKVINKQDEDLAKPFFFKAKDNSMINNGIRKNSLILIDKQASIKNKDIIICTIESKQLIRRINITKQKIILTAANPSYEPIKTTKEDINIIGKCISAVTDLS